MRACCTSAVLLLTLLAITFMFLCSPHQLILPGSTSSQCDSSLFTLALFTARARTVTGGGVKFTIALPLVLMRACQLVIAICFAIAHTFFQFRVHGCLSRVLTNVKRTLLLIRVPSSMSCAQTGTTPVPRSTRLGGASRIHFLISPLTLRPCQSLRAPS